MRIKFLGATGTVTGSSYLVTANTGEEILVDLGMYQGQASIDALNFQPLDFDPSKLTGVVLTHAHLDHCGRLPLLIKNGFTGNIYMTPPTADLTELSLLDSAKINEEDNKSGLYNREDVATTVQKFRTIDYDKQFNFGNVSVCLKDAGHILGSASAEITADGKKIVFSGDLGNSPEDIINPTERINNANAVVMESTYGDREHPKDDVKNIIQKEINAVEENNGTLLIPAFSLERTQELLHIISHLKATNSVSRDIRVYLDSPMAEKATLIYEKYKKYMNNEITQDYQKADPFTFPGLTVTKDRHESEKINTTIGAKVIISGSGMMTGGRIVGHAKVLLMIGSTRLLFVGYQAEETLGRQILEGAKNVDIEGVKIHINANINETQALSSHADQPKLLAWVKQIQGLQKVILTHGEDAARIQLDDKIRNELGINDVIIPKLRDTIEI